MTLRQGMRWIAAAMLLTVAVFFAKPASKWTDRHWTHGAIKDAWGSLRWREDWESAEALPSDLDDAWLGVAARPLRIAHAIGASGTSNANTLDALAAAMRDGFRLIEVDLWLDADGELRCQHDDDTAAPLRPGDCTLGRLLPRVAAMGGWVVLDIKSDFAAAGRAVLDLVRSNGLARHVVFQLYRAGDLELFAQWARQAPLAEPIVTTYASHRSAAHIAKYAPALHVRALTTPLEDLPILQQRPPGILLLVHPVHNCVDWRQARNAGVTGIYTLTRLQCDN